MRPMFLLNCCVLVVLAVAVVQARVDCAEPKPDWWKADSEAAAILLDGGADLARLAADAAASKPTAADEALFKLNVLMRAGMSAEAVRALGDLKAVHPDAGKNVLSGIYYAACDEYELWSVARSAVEVFADSAYDLALYNRLLKHLLETGWTAQKVERWLAGMPSGKDSFWLKERLRFDREHGLSETWVTGLETPLRKGRAGAADAIAYLDLLVAARHNDVGKRDLSWMPKAVKPRLATEASDVAYRLENLEEWNVAAPFYKTAIDMPITEEDVHRITSTCQVLLSDEKARAGIEAQVRDGLAKCLLKLGWNDEAQKWMVEAADIREKNKLGMNLRFAGEVQGASGASVIESRIREQEQKSENDPEYWQNRAYYYKGRKDAKREEEALTRGLALTTPQPPPERQGKGYWDWRSRFLTDYAVFLKSQKRGPEAVALLRQEIEQAPTSSESTREAARVLTQDFRESVSADDEVLWKWLSERPKWELTEERVLSTMLENLGQDDPEAFISRAEDLTKGTDPTRAYALGSILVGRSYGKWGKPLARRAIPLLEYARANTTDKELKSKAAWELFRAHLASDDWKQAEAVFAEAARRLTSREQAEQTRALAVSAAQSGAAMDAMRLWRRASNSSPRPDGYLGRMADAGMKSNLIAFYRELQKKMPSSEFPARALKELGAE